MSKADALLRVPPDSELAAGAELDAIVLRESSSG